ncbi:hypothetical protein C0995_012394 [Termitomyces sp. Mi166|nr:hypothetical protein C0995_012394 [Termitomyces sp. Mi166\
MEEESGVGRQTRKAAIEAKLLELSRQSDIYELLDKSLREMNDVRKGILLHRDVFLLARVLLSFVAYVTSDPDSKQLVLERFAVPVRHFEKGSWIHSFLDSGVLVSSVGGVCCIDEFHKMSDATRSVLP